MNVPFCILTDNEWEFCCLASSSASGVEVLDLGHSDRCVVVFHCCYNLHFLDDIECEASFDMLILHLYILLGEVCVKVFGSFFNQVIFFLLRFKSPLYILDSSPLLDVFYKYFLPVYFLLTLSLAEQKLLILLNSNLSIISFIRPASSFGSKKSWPYPRSCRFSSVLSSRSFKSFALYV